MTTSPSLRCFRRRPNRPGKCAKPSTMPTLHDTQQLLWKLITAPEGAAAALRTLSATERAASVALVRGDTRLAAIERIEIYADMYFYRIRDALKQDFAA